jgi:hypothetical protein
MLLQHCCQLFFSFSLSLYFFFKHSSLDQRLSLNSHSPEVKRLRASLSPCTPVQHALQVGPVLVQVIHGPAAKLESPEKIMAISYMDQKDTEVPQKAELLVLVLYCELNCFLRLW